MSDEFKSRQAEDLKELQLKIGYSKYLFPILFPSFYDDNISENKLQEDLALVIPGMKGFRFDKDCPALIQDVDQDEDQDIVDIVNDNVDNVSGIDNDSLETTTTMTTMMEEDITTTIPDLVSPSSRLAKAGKLSGAPKNLLKQSSSRLELIYKLASFDSV